MKSFVFFFLSISASFAQQSQSGGMSLPWSVANGGSGATTLTGLLKGNGTGAFTALTIPLTEANGGTNQSTYTTGDILYASAANTLSKLAVGSTGQVLTVASGKPSWATASSGGLTNITETLVTAAPNATIKVEELKINSNGSTDNDLSLVPKGNGAFILATPDNTTTGGNKRGTLAVDLQLYRIDQSHVASGSYSFAAGIDNTASGTSSTAIGYSNTASGTRSTAIGYGNTASGAYSFAVGILNTASAFYSIAMGKYANADKSGQFALATGQKTNLGDAQSSMLVPFIQTTNATANVELLLSGSDHITMPTNSAWIFTGTIIGKTSATANYSCWTIRGSAVNNGGTVTVNGITLVLVNDGLTLAATPPTVAADNTNIGIQIQVTGKAATTINWVAQIVTAEVTF